MKTVMTIDSQSMQAHCQTTMPIENIMRLAPEVILKAVVDSVAEKILAKYGDELEEMVLRGISPEAIAIMANAEVTKKAGERISVQIQAGTAAATARFRRRFGL